MDAKRPKILVIDDEQSLCDMLVYGLTRSGYDVSVAEHGKKALELARQDPFDLALCDLVMPGMGGVETLKALKESYPRMEVIVATGYATVETAVQSMKLGAYDYITKPYEMDELYSVLQRALERGRHQAKIEGWTGTERISA